ncbi:sensor histidine kinase [Aureibaculum conchae]|uniref:sensor histidine kinase n=1 Tax=Aureibaculum sp. 2308TA14-22 TaxID=3108392 RepID=UPI0033943771
MDFIRNKASKILIHLLFWALFVFISLFVFSNYYWKENPFLQYFFILIAIVYINNQLLLPYFIKKKWYFLYAIIIGLIAVLATQVYCNYFAQCGCSIMKCLSDYLWQTLVPIVFFSFVWVLFRFIDKQEEFEQIKLENTAMELQFLKSQINPHVLFNNLNTIYAYSLEKLDETPKMILKLSDNLKHVLHGSNSQFVSLQKEIEYLDNYIDFQKIRTEGVKIINYTKEIDSLNYEIAPLLLIGIIENAFKHSAAKTTIDIHIKMNEGELYCHCKNAIATPKSKENNTVIGLQNLKKRLSLLYPKKHSLVFIENEYFIANLKIKLQ